VLSRPPAPAELAALTAWARTAKLAGKQVVEDLVWALVNSKEFLYAH